jgi:glutamine amidotransferase
MQAVIIDYGSGNLRSAAKAVERAASDIGTGLSVQVTSDWRAVRDADYVILPGVGAFGDCLQGLEALEGMHAALQDTVITKGRPFLGICVGMQLLAGRGTEHGIHNGLGWIEGEVVPIDPADPTLKIPHMGWNELNILVPNHPVLSGISAGAHAYFVHSYAFQGLSKGALLADVDYGGAVTAIIGRDNLIGTQFHPEKSQATGLRFLCNFLRWKP